MSPKVGADRPRAEGFLVGLQIGRPARSRLRVGRREALPRHCGVEPASTSAQPCAVTGERRVLCARSRSGRGHQCGDG
eukprot:2050492-Prymnesium_polylepis.1